MNTAQGRSKISVTFTPKPTRRVTVPCPVYVRGFVVGELIEYDPETGRGRAAIDNYVPLSDILFLSIMEYSYTDLNVVPDEKSLNTPPDYAQIDAVIKTFAPKDTIDEDRLVANVLAKMGNPPEGGRHRAIIAHVRQWHVFEYSP